MRVLIVEDDRKLAGLLKKGLEENGHIASTAFNGIEGLEFARAADFDVFIFDIMLPGIDGFTIVRRLRDAADATPILLLTGRDANEDIVTGLDAGADDYLTKPFSFKVLLARLRALARRKQVHPRTELRIADLVLDPATHSVRRADITLTLTRTEFTLLELLMRNAGRVITRERAIDAVWGYTRDVESNTLDVFIRQLRVKVEPPGTRRLIHTVRGIGYALREGDGA
jgi:two-component system response regulator MprA